MPIYWNVLRLSSKEIGSSSVSLKMIFKPPQSGLFRFKFRTLSSKILKIPEFNLRMSHNKQSIRVKLYGSKEAQQFFPHRDFLFWVEQLFDSNNRTFTFFSWTVHFWPLEKIKLNQYFELFLLVIKCKTEILLRHKRDSWMNITEALGPDWKYQSWVIAFRTLICWSNTGQALL